MTFVDSGQLINFQKSTLTFSKNANTAHRQLVAGIFNMSHSDSLGKYLGCPLFEKKPNCTTFQELLKKAMSKLDGNCLSKAGYTVLIQSHLEALSAHTMQCFQLPNMIATQIDRLNREFFWKKVIRRKEWPQ